MAIGMANPNAVGIDRTPSDTDLESQDGRCERNRHGRSRGRIATKVNLLATHAAHGPRDCPGARRYRALDGVR